MIGSEVREGALCLPPDAPAAVRGIDDALHRGDVWHVVSHNPPVRSCREAARHRRRLGQIGIPLCDEVKSLVCGVDAGRRDPRYVVLHGRGHQRFDLHKAAAVVGRDLRAVSADELFDALGLEYGTVNPVSLSRRTDVLQIADDTLLAPFYPPHTVMTNCGDLRYALEMRAAEVGRWQGFAVADIVADGQKRVPRIRSLGLVTGSQATSGMLLWDRINEQIQRDPRSPSRHDFLPSVIVRSLPAMRASTDFARRSAELRSAVIEAVQWLCDSDVDMIGFSCDGMEYFTDDVAALCERRGVEFVAAASEIAGYLHRSGVRRFDLVSRDLVTDLDEVSPLRRALAGLDVEALTARQLQALRRLVHEVRLDSASPAARNVLRDLIGSTTDNGTTVIALGELSVLLSRQASRRPGRRVIDTLDVVAERMAQAYVSDRVAVGGA